MKTLFRRAIPALVGAFVLSAFGTAQATTTVYTSFGKNHTNCDCFSPLVLGPAVGHPNYLPPGTDWVAAEFAPSASGNLADVELALTLSSGYSAGVVILVPDDGTGQPNTLNDAALETWFVSKFDGNTNTQRPTKISSKLHPALTAGSNYWIIVEPASLDTFLTWWSSPTVSSSVLYSNNGGGSWNGYTGSQSAFEVDIE